MVKKIQILKHKRNQQIDSIARMKAFLNQPPDSKEQNIFEMKARLEKLLSISENFEATQSEIEIITEFDKSEVEFRHRFEADYFTIHAKFQEKISKFESNSISDQTPKQVIPTPVQFPLMNMPTFNGEYQQWPEFRDSFISLIDNNNSLSNVQKFHHLRSCLQRDVLETIKSIPVTDSNYHLAFKQLIERYDRKHLIANGYVTNILNFPKIFKESSIELRSLYNTVHNSLEALKSLGVEIPHWDLLLIPLIISKLDIVTVRDWEKFSIEKREVTFQELLNLVNNRAEFLERMESRKGSSKQISDKKSNFQSSPKSSVTVHVQSSVRQCGLCSGDHPVFKCIPFLKLGIADRIKRVKEKNLCLNCLKSTHSVTQCTSSKCKKCGKPHNTLLHLEIEKKPNEVVESKIGETSTVVATSIHSQGIPRTPNQVILPTALILVADKNNEWHRCRALLDCAAMSNFISRELHSKLQLPIKTVMRSIKGVGSSVQNIHHQTNITFSSILENRAHFQATCLILDRITSDLPLFSFNKDKLQIPGNVILADSTFHTIGKIDILLGSSLFWELLKDGRIKVPYTGLFLQNTKLGWIVGGFSQFRKTNTPKETINCTTIDKLSLEDQVRKFWEVEEVKSTKVLSREDRICEESFVKTHTRSPDGRFVVKVPFKPTVQQLGDSKQSALKRFSFLEKRLNKDPNLKQDYSKIIDEYISLGHMREIDDENEHETACYYIPHHAVFRKESLTTKTRVVFDASMQTTSGLSLNDVQYVGPTIQNDLFSILMNFRIHKYVMTSDISKMYRMVWLHEDHKPFHRICWRKNPQEKIKCFELQTVTFGTASAPFLAVRCLHQLATENYNNHPKTAEIIKNNFYVDDLIFGAESLTELLQIQHDVTTILASAGFYLRKWLCNNEEVHDKLKLVPNLECNILNFGAKEYKTLGLAWNPIMDKIFYSDYQFESNSLTKRKILSEISKIFDPLGLLGPILVIGKLLMQRSWQENISWDEPITSELLRQWCDFQRELNNIRLIQINRQVLINDFDYFEIHGFCDASQKAYGACIFVRSFSKGGEISSHLLCSKSRIAPIKPISLPRLELNAALLLAQLVDKVVKKLEIKPKVIHYWSDSQISLAWIRGNPTRWKTFVANRVGEIQELTDVKNWHHVQSSENPADILSRGAIVNQLINSEIWWSGPSWLSDEVIIYDNKFQCLKEIPEEKILVHMNIKHECDLINRYSNFDKLKRITAYCIRFAKNCKLPREKRNFGELTVNELKRSQFTLIRVMQIQAFPKEYKILQAQKPLPNQSRLLPLNPFLDNDQLIRVGGRLEKTNLQFDSKHPIVLAPDSTLTKLIMNKIHVDNFHCGPTALLSFVRQNYWPIDGRNLAKGIVRRCRVCFFERPKSIQYLMGQLPECRASRSFPFQNVGVDYAGPVLIKDRKTRNPKTLKAYVCLFICMATKAIHLECVSDLSTEAFILCLKRFISRRGKPSNIFSDNAKNFVGANAEIKRLNTYITQNFPKINTYLTNQEIHWHFIPARTPSFGGIWEAGIKSVKSHLNKVTRNIKFDFEQLSTLLCQIEAILNSRPLTPLSTDPSDLDPLTPSHFLIGRSLNQHPEISNPSTIPISRLTKYKQLESVIDQFWNRWSREYIHQLQVRSKWRKNSEEESAAIQVGKLVLLKEDTHPFQWPMGRITELHPGTDGIVRVVSIKVHNGVVTRGISKICILPEES